MNRNVDKAHQPPDYSELPKYELNDRYWDERYVQGNAPWDLLTVSTPIKYLIGKYVTVQDKILIPGAGRGHELNWLRVNGYHRSIALDWSNEAISEAKALYPEIDDSSLLTGDFFQHRGSYDVIIEQTFFCALPPTQRPDYARHVADLLPTGGLLVGVWFVFALTEKGPPFGGSPKEYHVLFDPYFEWLRFEPCRVSAPERWGKEWLMVGRRK